MDLRKVQVYAQAYSLNQNPDIFCPYLFIQLSFFLMALSKVLPLRNKVKLVLVLTRQSHNTAIPMDDHLPP